MATSSSQNTKGGPRRHAGSSIPTGMDPLGQVRRVPYRPIAISNVGGVTDNNSKDELKVQQKSGTNSPILSPNQTESSEATHPIMSTSVPRSLGLPAPKTSIGSIKSPGASSLKSSLSIGSDNVLSSSTESFRSDDESLTSSVSSSSPGSSKLSRSSSSVTESSSPGLRTRFAMPSGRATPTLGGERSGLARPSRLQKEQPNSSANEGLIKKRSNTLDSNSSLSVLKSETSASDEGLNNKPSGLSKPSQLSRPEATKNKEESKLQRLTQLPTKLKGPNNPTAITPTGTTSTSAGTTGNPTGISNGIIDATHEPSPPPPSKDSEEPSENSTSKLAMLTRKSPGQIQKSSQLKKGPSLLSTLTSKDTPTEQGTPPTEGQAPPTSKLQAPPTSKLQAPPTKLQGPPTSRLQALPSSKLQAPPSNKLQAPPSSKLQAPPTSKLQAPPTSKLQASSKEELNNDDTVSKGEKIKPEMPQEAAPTLDVIKSRTLPPLQINSETTPPKPTTSGSSADPRSSSSSIASSNSGHSSSNTDLQTPSPFGERKYAQRTSPEGMSVDETASPRDHRLSDSSETEKNNKEEGEFSVSDKENIITSSPSTVKRAQSLSPKFSRRIFPIPSHLSDAQQQQNSIVLSPGSDDSLSSTDKQPKRSSLRTTSRKPGDTRSDKHVKLSPHSSVESFSSSDVSLGQSTAPPPTVSNETPVRVGEQKRRISQNERPKSMEDLEKHTFAVAGFPGDLQTNLVRRGSTRSERLDYSSVETFLETGLQERNGSSTPEVSPLFMYTY